MTQAPTGNFRCEICNMEATDQVGLKIHLAGKKHIMKLAQADSVGSVNPADISILKKESKKNLTEDVCGQLAASDMAKESDQKMNESELDLDKKHKKKLEMSQAKVIY